jgi:hypothetical protein
MKRAPLVASVVLLSVLWEFSVPARADQVYAVAGRDSFSIGAGDIQSEVTYAGTQTLSLRRHGRLVRFKAHVHYQRSDGAASTPAGSDFVADVLPTGEVLDSADNDPDYLTVLNQPFAAQLDAATIGDLRRLEGTLPFDFPSPMTGSSLHGYLKHIADGKVAGRRTLGVRFEAAGPMKGALPDRPGLTLVGTISMRGTAFYDIRTSLLMALQTTVTIEGSVSNRTNKDPVKIVYDRTIRATAHGAAETARSPQP